MSLRERKAETRKRIADEGLRLFKRNGYEQTTMEAIAEAAEVSPATLYRYFPSKDLILVDHYMFFFEGVQAGFSKYAVDYPVDEALVKTVLAVLRFMDDNSEKIRLVRSIIDNAPIPRARLVDLHYIQTENMSQLLAEKLKLPKDDLRVVLTVGMVQLVISVAGDMWHTNRVSRSAVACGKQAIKILEANHGIWPAKSTPNKVRKPRSNSR